MRQEDLASMIKTNFQLMHYHHWDLAYLDTIMPLERYNYLHILQDLIAEEERRELERQSGRKSASNKHYQPPAQPPRARR